MKASIYFLFFFLFLSGVLDLKAQTNFVNGYFVTQHNDTIQGFIEYRSGNKNYEQINFKPAHSDEVRTLYPHDVLMYSLENKLFYQTHEIEIEEIEKKKFAFLKVLIDNNLSLLEYKNIYFVLGPEGKLSEITKKQKTIDKKIKNDVSGMGALLFYMKDCGGMSKFIKRKYRHNPDYYAIFEEYYKCLGTPISNIQIIDISPKLTVGILGSASAKFLSFSSKLKAAEIEPDIKPKTGIYASLFIPKISESLRVVAEVSYSSYNKYYHFGDFNYNDLFLNYKFLQIPLILRYYYKNLYLNIGIHNQIVLEQELSWRTENVVDGNKIYTIYKDFPPLNTFNIGYMMGIGLKYKIMNYNLQTEFRYSNNQYFTHEYVPNFNTLDLVFSLPLKEF